MELIGLKILHTRLNMRIYFYETNEAFSFPRKMKLSLQDTESRGILARISALVLPPLNFLSLPFP